MDGDHVNLGPSDDDTNSIKDNPSTLTEIFYQICPQYMAMGMTYDEFWHFNTVAHKAYREAYEIRIHNDEYDRWRRGMYIYDALIKVAPILRAFGKGSVKPGKYPEMPYPLTEKEAQEREEQQRKANLERLLAMLNKESEEANKVEVGKDADN